MYPDLQSIFTTKAICTDNRLLPAASCAYSHFLSKRRVKYLDMCKIRVNTHTHTHIATDVVSRVNILIIINICKGGGLLFTGVFRPFSCCRLNE